MTKPDTTGTKSCPQPVDRVTDEMLDTISRFSEALQRAVRPSDDVLATQVTLLDSDGRRVGRLVPCDTGIWLFQRAVCRGFDAGVIA